MPQPCHHPHIGRVLAAEQRSYMWIGNASIAPHVPIKALDHLFKPI
jgi:hypothetical protein